MGRWLEACLALASGMLLNVGLEMWSAGGREPAAYDRPVGEKQPAAASSRHPNDAPRLPAPASQSATGRR